MEAKTPEPTAASMIKWVLLVVGYCKATATRYTSYLRP